MKIFIDSANLIEIEAALKRGFISGITTNPSLLSKEPRTSFSGHIHKIIDLINRYRPGLHLSVEVFSRDRDEMLRQAQDFIKEFNYPAMSIKVQIGWDELETVAALSQKGISVNCTACMTVSQGMMAAQAGARYVSLFWGRIRDGGTDENNTTNREKLVSARVLDQKDFDPAFVVSSVRQGIERAGLNAEIIAGSIRGVVDIRDAAAAGAHIVTVPPKFFLPMASHYKTDEVVEQFLSDFKAWMH